MGSKRKVEVKAKNGTISEVKNNNNRLHKVG